jgi:hypothetical protein
MSIISEFSETHTPVAIADRDHVRTMEQLLMDLLVELQILHKSSRNSASKKNLIKFIERIRASLPTRKGSPFAR